MSGKNPGLFFQPPAGSKCSIARRLSRPGRGSIRARRTLISTGTELTRFNARTRPGSVWEEINKFPQAIGYSHVGEVVAVGSGVEASWVGRRVDTHSFHAAYVTCSVEQPRPLPDLVSDEDATFTTLAEVTMNGFRRARLSWGETVAVFGLGLLGHLCVRLGAVIGAGPIFAIEVLAFRRNKAPQKPWVHCLDGEGLESDPTVLRAAVEKHNQGRRVDLAIELTGLATLIPMEFEVLRDQGRFLVLSSPRDATLFDFHDLCNRRSLSIVGAHGFSHPR